MNHSTETRTRPVEHKVFDHWKPREMMSHTEMLEELRFLKKARLEMRPELEARRRSLVAATELAD